MQPIPMVTKADVVRVPRRDFPAGPETELLVMLDEHGTRDWQVNCDRVQLAVLELSFGDIYLLLYHLNDAMDDFGDVLALAESPGRREKAPGASDLSDDEMARIVDADRRQYQEWLTR